MMRALRRSVLWLMILLMPLQAMAGFVMPHGAVLGPSPSAGHPAPSEATHVLHAPCHGAMSAQSRPHAAATGAMQSIATHDATHDATPDVQDPRQDSAGLCPSCCLMLVLPSATPPKAMLTSCLAKPVLVSGRPRSHIPDGPDRPPRPRLA